MNQEANLFCFDPNVQRTVWMLELHRPVVHEHRPDGTVITHINPSGSKSTLVWDLIEQLRKREAPTD